MRSSTIGVDMKLRLLAYVVLTVITLSACQTMHQTSVSAPEGLLPDIAFNGTAQQPEPSAQIFALPEQTKVELARILTNTQSVEERTKSALKLIFSYAKDGLLYDNAATKTASETIASGKANCLSLSILAYSMAKELGMSATFQDIQIPEYWTSALSQTWLNGHINVRLQQHRVSRDFSGMVILGSDFVVDFDPYSLKQQFPERSIDTNTVVAMFYNNKAALAFATDNYAGAYSYYKAAAKAAPDYAVTWSNLGVLYRVNGMYELAELSYQHSLALKPDATNTLANLAVLYRQTGRQTEAQRLEQTVMAKRSRNPYYFLMLGNEAFSHHDYIDAIEKYKNAVTLDNKNHEAYFGLARTYYVLNENEQAVKYMKKARRNAPSNEDQQRYEHKLSILNQLARVH